MDAYERDAQKKENRSVSVSEKEKQSVDEFRHKFFATTGNTNSSKPLRKNSWIIKIKKKQMVSKSKNYRANLKLLAVRNSGKERI